MNAPGSSKVPPAPTLIRVLVVDDHRIFATGVTGEITRADPGISVVAQAHDVASAIDEAQRLRPDVVLLDVHLPGGAGGGGAEVAQSLQDLTTPDGAPVRALALSVSDAEEDVLAVIRAGARGYVTKSITGEDLADALHRVAGGDAVFSPRLAGFVLDAFRTSVPTSSTELDLLSVREQEVMKLIARGYTPTVRPAQHCSSRTARWRATSPACCANCSCPTAVSSRAGRVTGA